MVILSKYLISIEIEYENAYFTICQIRMFVVCVYIIDLGMPHIAYNGALLSK